MQDITRRQFLAGSLFAVGAAASLGLAGCSGSTAAASASTSGGGPVELKYWYCWTDKIKENNEERVREFNDSIGNEKGIHVTAEYQGSYDDLNSKLKSAFVANEEPDVCVMVINGTKAFADGGMIQPLTGLVSDSDLNDFWPGLMENCYVDNTLYGLPYLRSTPVLYYNKTIFDKAGIDSTKAPETWGEVVAAAKAVKALGIAGYGFYSYDWVLTALAYCNGGSTFDEKDLAGSAATFNQAPAVEMVKWLKQGSDEGYFDFLGGSNASDTLDTDASNQQVGMWINSTGNITSYKTLSDQGGFQIGCGFIPKNVQNKVPTGGCDLVMTSRLEGDTKQAAAEFINFMTSSDAAIKSHLKTGYLLTRESARSDQRITDAYAQNPMFDVAFKQLEYGVGDCMNVSYGEASKVYTDAVEKIMGGNDDPQQVLDAAAVQANAILAG